MNSAKLPQRLCWVLASADGMAQVSDGHLRVYLSPADAQEALAKLASAELEVRPIHLKVVPPEETTQPRKPKGGIPYA